MENQIVVEQKDPKSSKLFQISNVDFLDELVLKYERAYQNIQVTINGLNDKELHDLLTTLVSKDNKQHEDISLGLLYIILTDSTQAQKTYRDLTLIARDGLAFVITSIIQLIAEKYQKLSDISKRQLLWLLRELVKNQVLGIDNIVWNLLRQATGGDVSPRNILLIEGMLDIFIEHRAWIEKNPFIIMTVCYTFVRLIEDHNSPHLIPLRNKEVKFIISLIRDRFAEVIPLGREFVRLLQNVARIPEFDLLWKDILLNPKTLHPTFTGIWHLLQIRTSRKFLAARLTPEIERKLIFLTNQVKFGNHKRYQDWFQDKYFTTQESQTLRSDLIRYIITAIHPTNDMLCSDIMPRWAIIGWLLTSCTNQTALANAKLAVFYDWLFFDPNKDNIMNVEPGILVMYHSIKNHPMVSSTLLDFLCRIMKNFYPKGEERIRAGVYNSLRKILEKQVIPNIGPLFESPKLDTALRMMIRENFREFCVNALPETPANFIPAEEVRAPITTTVLPIPASGVVAGEGGGGGPPPIVNNSITDDHEAKFSDDEDDDDIDDVVKIIKIEDDDDDDDDLPLSKVRLKEKTTDKVELPAQIRDSFEVFLNTKSLDDFEDFLSDFKSGCSLNEDQEQYVFDNVINICKSTLPEKWIHPDEDIEDVLEDTINYPINGLFKILYHSEEKCKKHILELLDNLRERVPAAGYLLLYFLKTYAKLQTKGNIFKKNCYEIYYDNSDLTLIECLVQDLTQLEEFNTQMFLWLIPDLYREFKNDLINNSDVLRIVVSCIDAKNLTDLIYNVSQGKLVLFEDDGAADIVRSSLSYETFEQFCLWQLIQAHNVPFDSLKDLIPELETSHHEAISCMLLLLRNVEPTEELIRLLFSRETKNRDESDHFVTSALSYWCDKFLKPLLEITSKLLRAKYPSNMQSSRNANTPNTRNSPNTRKKGKGGSQTGNSSQDLATTNSPSTRKNQLKRDQQNGPTFDLVLNHLENFRRVSIGSSIMVDGFYAQTAMQEALQHAFYNSSDSQKKQFSDLFALAAERDTSSRRISKSRSNRTQPNKKETTSTSSGSAKKAESNKKPYSSDGSSDEEWSKQKNSAKRRKKAIPSDSD